MCCRVKAPLVQLSSSCFLPWNLLNFPLEHHRIFKAAKSCPLFGRSVGILRLSQWQKGSSWLCCFSSCRIRGSGNSHPWKWAQFLWTLLCSLPHLPEWTHPGELSVQDGINNCTLQLLRLLGIINMNS